MARLIDKDFSRLATFLNQYSLADVLTSRVREQLVKRGHKYSLAALQIWAAAEQSAQTGKFKIMGTPLQVGSPHFDQLAESFSDLTSAYFAALHGLYKPAHMSLRSGIETFIRGLTGLNSSEAASTKNVYRLFEIASNSNVFQLDAKVHFDRIHQEYVELCGYTHSATTAHMVKNYAMSSFPKQDIENLRIWVRHCEAVIKAMLAILVFADRSLYLSATPNAQDVYEETVPKEARLFALGAPTA
jgi:hypothetical protein